MKTIGERFDEMAEVAGVSKTDKSYYFGRSCCFQIAKEQRAIDTKEFMEESLKMLKAERERVKTEMIDKACHYLRKEYEQANTLIRAVCDREVGDLIDIDASVKTFIKMMKK